MTVRPATLAILGAAFLATLPLAGCYTNSPTLFETANDTYTYESIASRPINIDLVDTRDGTIFFSMKVPVGKQLSFNFQQTGGDDPVYRPSRMTWAVMDNGTAFGSLSNSMSAPPRHARRIDLSFRKPGEYAPEPVQAPMRAQQPGSPEQTAVESTGPTPNAKRLYN
jgi:hypothetical protein